MAPPKIITTSFLVGNLHCPSCVAVIKKTLEDEYAGRVFWVSPNVVTSVVTVEHEDASANFIRDMGKTLEDVGFEICAVDTTGTMPDELNRESDAEQARTSQDSRRRGSGALDLWWRLWELGHLLRHHIKAKQQRIWTTAIVAKPRQRPRLMKTVVFWRNNLLATC